MTKKPIESDFKDICAFYNALDEYAIDLENCCSNLEQYGVNLLQYASEYCNKWLESCKSEKTLFRNNMNAIEYLQTLIAGLEMGSEIPIQLSELKSLLTMLEK